MTIDRQIASYLSISEAPFSTDWESAVLAAKEMDRIGWGVILRGICPLFSLSRPFQWRAEFFDGDMIVSDGVGHVQGFIEFHGIDESGPLAICKAILNVRDGKDVQSEMKREMGLNPSEPWPESEE